MMEEFLIFWGSLSKECRNKSAQSIIDILNSKIRQLTVISRSETARNKKDVCTCFRSFFIELKNGATPKLRMVHLDRSALREVMAEIENELKSKPLS